MCNACFAVKVVPAVGNDDLRNTRIFAVRCVAVDVVEVRVPVGI